MIVISAKTKNTHNNVLDLFLIHVTRSYISRHNSIMMDHSNIKKHATESKESYSIGVITLRVDGLEINHWIVGYIHFVPWKNKWSCIILSNSYKWSVRITIKCSFCILSSKVWKIAGINPNNSVFLFMGMLESCLW